jgi:hypothetical protein
VPDRRRGEQTAWWALRTGEDVRLRGDPEFRGVIGSRNARQMERQGRYIQRVIGFVVVQAHSTGCPRTRRILRPEILRRANRKPGDKTEEHGGYRESLFVVAHDHANPRQGYVSRLPRPASGFKRKTKRHLLSVSGCITTAYAGGPVPPHLCER